MSTKHDDPACAMAAGEMAPQIEPRTVVAVFASPVAKYLLHFARDSGFRTVLLEPDVSRIDEELRRHADTVVAGADKALLDDNADVVVTDHDRSEMGSVLRDVLAHPVRWVGVMGTVRVAPPHVEQLRALGVADEVIARVHRPIGLNIGSQIPAEIAVATLAGLIAHRRDRPGGFDFAIPESSWVSG